MGVTDSTHRGLPSSRREHVPVAPPREVRRPPSTVLFRKSNTLKHCQKMFLVINMYCFDLWKCVQDRDSLGAARTAPPAPCLLRFLQRGHPALAASVGLHPASVPRLGACRAPPRAPQQLLPFPAGEGAGRCHLQLQPPGPRPGEDIPDLLGAGGTKGCPPQTLASELLLPHQPFPPLPGPI